MKRYVATLLILSFGVVLSGCPKQAGFDITPAVMSGPEQPWQAHALNADLGNFFQMTVARILIHPTWMGDGIGYIVEHEADGEKKRTFWRREVWRALFFNKAGGVEVYPAVITPCPTHVLVLFPNRTAEDLDGGTLLILSGSGRKGQTMRQEIVFPLDLDRLIGDVLFRQDFFRAHASLVTREALRDHSINTPQGQRLIEQMKIRWPKIAEIKGSTYMVNPETMMALSVVTNHASYLDRIISQGGIVIGPTMAAYPIGTAVAAANIFFNLGLAANDKNLKGSFFEAVYTGEEVGLTYAPIVGCVQEMQTFIEQQFQGGGTK